MDALKANRSPEANSSILGHRELLAHLNCHPYKMAYHSKQQSDQGNTVSASIFHLKNCWFSRKKVLNKVNTGVKI